MIVCTSLNGLQEHFQREYIQSQSIVFSTLKQSIWPTSLLLIREESPAKFGWNNNVHIVSGLQRNLLMSHFIF